MKIVQKSFQTLKKVYFFFILFLCTVNCFYFTDSLRKAKKALSRGDCRKSREFLSSSQKTDLSFALKAARFCEEKSVKDGVWFYKYLSQQEKTKEKRLFFKDKLADIYFDKLNDYENAFSLWFFLRDQSSQINIKLLYAYKIAQGFFEIQKWEESVLELNKYLNMISQDSEFQKDFLFLKGRVLLMQEQFKESEQVFRQIQIQHPQFFQDKSIYWYLSLIYEAQKDFQQAIKELKKFQHSSEFLQGKIQRLKKREENLPARPPDVKPSDLKMEDL